MAARLVHAGACLTLCRSSLTDSSALLPPPLAPALAHRRRILCDKHATTANGPSWLYGPQAPDTAPEGPANESGRPGRGHHGKDKGPKKGKAHQDKAHQQKKE